MKKIKTSTDTCLALKDLIDAFVKARVCMDGNDMETWRVLLRYETKINELKRKVEETAKEAAE